MRNVEWIILKNKSIILAKSRKEQKIFPYVYFFDVLNKELKMVETNAELGLFYSYNFLKISINSLKALTIIPVRGRRRCSDNKLSWSPLSVWN